MAWGYYPRGRSPGWRSEPDLRLVTATCLGVAPRRRKHSEDGSLLTFAAPDLRSLGEVVGRCKLAKEVKPAARRSCSSKATRARRDTRPDRELSGGGVKIQRALHFLQWPSLNGMCVDVTNHFKYWLNSFLGTLLTPMNSQYRFSRSASTLNIVVCEFSAYLQYLHVMWPEIRLYAPKTLVKINLLDMLVFCEWY